MKKLILFFVALTVCALSCKTEQKTTSTNSPLCETKWQLTYIDCKEIEESPETPFIVFAPDGSFSGSLGCNSFFGSYIVNKENISIEYRGSTKKLCDNMTVEKDFSKALKSQINNYVIVGDVLIVRVKNNEVLRFKALPKNE